MKVIAKDPSVCIVIPVYRDLSGYGEWVSLDQCLRVLGAYPVKVVKPRSLDLDHIKEAYPAIDLVSFDDDYFAGIAGYNRLLTSIEFYRTFLPYEYMLIHQLDAFVFADVLLDWCRKGYDYVGAPSLHQEEFDMLPAGASEVWRSALASHRRVFNGGLSLRRVPAFIRYLRIYHRFYPPWEGNEDMLFSQEATRLLPMKLFLRLPAWQDALLFAFEKSPAATYELTAHQLPFGCHAWERYDPGFWRPFMDTSRASG